MPELKLHPFPKSPYRITFVVASGVYPATGNKNHLRAFGTDHPVPQILYGRLDFLSPPLTLRLNGIVGPVAGYIQNTDKNLQNRQDVYLAYTSMPKWVACGRIDTSDILLFPLNIVLRALSFSKILDAFGGAANPNAALQRCTEKYHVLVLPPAP